MYSIKQVAKLANISIRTLHYYHKIGLLIPDIINNNGYRFYNEQNLIRLQQILFYKELDFDLKTIAEILDKQDASYALKNQKELLILKRDRLNNLINLIEENLIKEEYTMELNEFNTKDIEQQISKYKAEVKEKWGNTKEYKEFKQKGDKNFKKSVDALNQVLKEFSKIEDSTSNQAITLAKKWQDCISENFYECSDEVLLGLADMYINDERFNFEMDKYKKGTTKVVHDAIYNYINKKR